MRKMKKFTSLVLVSAMCMSLAACGNNDEKTPETSGTEVTTEIATETTAAEAGYKNDVTVADIEAAVATAVGEAYYANTPVESLEALEITEDMYTEFIYKMPMISVNVDTLIVVKAAEGKVADVEAKLNQYRDNNINDLMQYPMNLTKIQCSQVATFGDYVVFVQLGADKGTLAVEAASAAAGEQETLSEDEMVAIEMEAINEQNEIALAAIETILTK